MKNTYLIACLLIVSMVLNIILAGMIISAQQHTVEVCSVAGSEAWPTPSVTAAMYPFRQQYRLSCHP